MGKTIFVTGTDTGAGKTIFTLSLLSFLRSRGSDALAVKPFSSGDRCDAELLFHAQEGELPMDAVNPYFFRQPLAPGVTMQMGGINVPLFTATRQIKRISKQCDLLLVEGCGGLLVPLGQRYSVLELIEKVADAVIVVARNRLGVINHVLLTVRALQDTRCRELAVVLMDHGDTDLACKSNRAALAQRLNPVTVVSFPFLGKQLDPVSAVTKHRKKIEKALAGLLELDTLSGVRES